MLSANAPGKTLRCALELCLDEGAARQVAVALAAWRGVERAIHKTPQTKPGTAEDNERSSPTAVLIRMAFHPSDLSDEEGREVVLDLVRRGADPREVVTSTKKIGLPLVASLQSWMAHAQAILRAEALEQRLGPVRGRRPTGRL